MFLSTYYIVVHSYKIKLMLKQQIMITYYSHISFEAIIQKDTTHNAKMITAKPHLQKQSTPPAKN